VDVKIKGKEDFFFHFEQLIRLKKFKIDDEYLTLGLSLFGGKDKCTKGQKLISFYIDVISFHKIQVNIRTGSREGISTDLLFVTFLREPSK
jgi:hypothetical protein